MTVALLGGLMLMLLFVSDGEVLGRWIRDDVRLMT